MPRKLQTIICLTTFAIGAAIGYAFSQITLDRTVDANALLYGSARVAESHLEVVNEDSESFHAAIDAMLTDFRGTPPVSEERKLRLIEFSNTSDRFGQLILSLSLGAVQDQSPEVRTLCVDVLTQLAQAFDMAEQMITKNLDQETQQDILQKKIILLSYLSDSVSSSPNKDSTDP